MGFNIPSTAQGHLRREREREAGRQADTETERAIWTQRH